MIYGPYKRKGKLKMTKLPQHATHYGYNARPDKRIVRLRLALAASLTALVALGIKMLYLTPTTLEMASMAVLAGASLLLLCLLRRLDHRKRRY